MYFDPFFMAALPIHFFVPQGSEALLMNKIDHYMNISLASALSRAEDKKVTSCWCALFGLVCIIWNFVVGAVGCYLATVSKADV